MWLNINFEVELDMKYTLQNSQVRKIDDALKITDLFSIEDTSFDFVIAELDGEHPTTVNTASDRAYFILDGDGVVTVNNTPMKVIVNNLVYIKKGHPHSIIGKVKYAIITAPPFRKENESLFSGK